MTIGRSDRSGAQCRIAHARTTVLDVACELPFEAGIGIDRRRQVVPAVIVLQLNHSFNLLAVLQAVLRGLSGVVVDQRHGTGSTLVGDRDRETEPVTVVTMVIVVTVLTSVADVD